MAEEIIEERDGGYYIVGTRVSLDSVVDAFRRGESPETICQNFETLQLEEVCGAIAYYLANEADTYLARQGQKCEEGRPRTFLRLAGAIDGPRDLSSRKGCSKPD